MDQLDLVVKMKRGQNTCLYAPALFVKRKLQAELGKNTPTKVCIAATFEGFSETGTVKYRERSRRLPKATHDKVEDVHDFCTNEPQVSI